AALWKRKSPYPSILFRVLVVGLSYPCFQKSPLLVERASSSIRRSHFQINVDAAAAAHQVQELAHQTRSQPAPAGVAVARNVLNVPFTAGKLPSDQEYQHTVVLFDHKAHRCWCTLGGKQTRICLLLP